MPPQSKTTQVSVDGESEATTTEQQRWPTPALDDETIRMSYNIARGEQGVLTFEPYKSVLLPHWRFKTVPIAQESSQTLWNAFEYYVKAKDFVGADMARKFIQMGMTRAKRYANHAGGRKYDRTARQVEAKGGKRTELPKSTGHKGQEEKLAASEVFREVWRRCTSDEGYVTLREEWKGERKEWDGGRKREENEGGEVVKEEGGDANAGHKGPVKREEETDDD